jgi:hypothetical protein
MSQEANKNKRNLENKRQDEARQTAEKIFLKRKELRGIS